MADSGQNSNVAGQANANALRRRINRQAADDEEGVTYMECRRNVSIPAGRYTVDGCTEFLKGESDRENPMLCMACGCHRSFHRRVAPPSTHLRNAAARYLFYNDIRNFVRPLMAQLQPRPQAQPQPRPRPQPQLQPRPPLQPQLRPQALVQPPRPPRPLMPQPAEMPRPLVAENESEEEEEEEEERSDEDSDESSEIIDESEFEDEDDYGVNNGSGGKDNKED